MLSINFFLGLVFEELETSGETTKKAGHTMMEGHHDVAIESLAFPVNKYQLESEQFVLKSHAYIVEMFHPEKQCKFVHLYAYLIGCCKL